MFFIIRLLEIVKCSPPFQSFSVVMLLLSENDKQMIDTYFVGRCSHHLLDQNLIELRSK